MEGNRRPSENGPSRKSYKTVSTQTCKTCLVCCQETCSLCGNSVLSVSSPNEIPVGDDLPDDICQCFFPNNNVPGAANFDNVPGAANFDNVPGAANFDNVPGAANFDNVPGAANFDNVPGAANFDNVPGAARFAGEQNVEEQNVAKVPIGDFQDANLHPDNEEYRIEESNNDESGNEESKLFEYSLSSNGHDSPPSEQSFDPHLYLKTPVSSDKSSKNSPIAETSRNSNDYALFLHEQSFDQNFPDHRNIESPISARGSRNSPNTEKGGSSGYPSSPNEHSLDENFADRRKSTSSSSEDSKSNIKIENGEASIQSLHENNLEQLNISECRLNESFSNDRGENDRTRRGEYDYRYPFNVDENVQYERSVPSDLSRFRSNNPRPVLPPPFHPPYPQFPPQPVVPFYQPHRNPAMNISMQRPSLPHPRCHSQPIQPYGIPTMNMPINQTDVPGRFPVSRPEMSASYHRRPYDGTSTLSKSLMQLGAEEDTEKRSVKADKIKDWLEKLSNVPTEEAAALGYENVWSTAENEENEGIPPFFPEISTDERSSTEISEEENRRQRSLRRPPRNRKPK